MQAKKQRTTSPSARTRPTTESTTRSIGKPAALGDSAFSAHFLERTRRRESAALAAAGTREGTGRCQSRTPLSRHARWVGPWEVEPVPAGDSSVLHATTRRSEPASEGGGARMTCQLRQDALLGAATFVTLAAPNNLTLNTDKPSGRRSALGYPIHDGPRHIGHISPAVEGSEDAFLAAYHTLRCLAAHPDAAALFLEALDPETLALLGRAAMRRLT